MSDQQLAQSVNSIVSEIPGSDGESPKNIPGEENVENVDSLVDFEKSSEFPKDKQPDLPIEQIETLSAEKEIPDNFQEPSERTPTKSSEEPNETIDTLITGITNDIDTITAYVKEKYFLKEVNKNKPAHGPK